MNQIINQIRDMEATPATCPVCGNQWGPCPCDLEIDELFLMLVPTSREAYLAELVSEIEEQLIEGLLCAPFFVTDLFAG